VERKWRTTKVEKAFLDAGFELGYNTIDPNAETQIGM